MKRGQHHLHCSPADQSGADQIAGDQVQHLQAAPEPAWRPLAAAPAASALPMGMATLLLRFGAGMLSPDSRRLFCPATDLLHPIMPLMHTSHQQHCYEGHSLLHIVPVHLI